MFKINHDSLALTPQKQLDPLNEELAMVTAHFEKLIAIEKNELDDRRKKSSLSKFLSERVKVLFF